MIPFILNNVLSKRYDLFVYH